MKLFKIFILFFLLGCSNSELKDANVQLLKAKNGSIATKSNVPSNTLSYIKLETKPESLLGYIMNVEIVNSACYVLDRTTLYKFGLEGNFINKIPQGNGPGEIKFPLNFNFDVERNEIYIIEMGNKLHIYDDNLNYNRTFVLDGSFVDVIRLDDDNFLLCSALVGDYEPYLISKFNIESNLIVEKYISMVNNPMKDLSILTYNNFQFFNGQIYLTVSNSRFIYNYNDNNTSSLYQISMESYEPSVDYINRFKKTKTFRKTTYEDELISFINYFYQFENITLMGIKHKKYNCGIRFNNDNSIYLSKLSDLFDLPKSKSFERPCSIGENKIHFVYDNDILLEKDQNKDSVILFIQNDSLLIRQNENPTIVTVNIK